MNTINEEWLEYLKTTYPTKPLSQSQENHIKAAYFSGALMGACVNFSVKTEADKLLLLVHFRSEIIALANSYKTQILDPVQRN